MRVNEMEYNTGNIEKYNSTNPLKQFMIKLFLNKLKQAVAEIKNKYKSMDLLDIGCGEGLISNLLYDNFDNINITAVDYFAEAIEKAQKGNNRHIFFETGDITNLKYEDNSFDTAMAIEVLEHIAKPEKALKELLRVSKNNIILSVPNEPFFCLGNLLSGKNIKRLGNPIDHINHWTSRSFKRFLRNIVPTNYTIKTYNCYVWTMVVISYEEQN